MKMIMTSPLSSCPVQGNCLSWVLNLLIMIDIESKVLEVIKEEMFHTPGKKSKPAIMGVKRLLMTWFREITLNIHMMKVKSGIKHTDFTEKIGVSPLKNCKEDDLLLPRITSLNQLLTWHRMRRTGREIS